MSNAVFPALPGITWDYHQTPSFATKKQESVGGIELTASFQPYSRSSWSLSYEVLRSHASYTELQTLLQFFIARQGAFDTFLFTAIDNSTATTQQIGIGDGTTLVFQLLDQYGEPIYNLNGTPTIYVNGSSVSSSTYTISAGVLTFNSGHAPGNTYVVAWTGAFYWRVRFQADTLDFGAIVSGMWDAKRLILTQVLGS